MTLGIHEIISAGNPLLKRRSDEVPFENITTPEIQKLIDDMIVTMRHCNGAGLAAPQIGKSIRIFCYELDKNPRYPEIQPIPLQVFINPVVQRHSDNKEIGFEGCLSLGTLRGQVPRFQSITIKAYDRKGNEIIKHASGFEARIIQHEIDHLDGIFFIERMNDFSLFGFTEILRQHRIIP